MSPYKTSAFKHATVVFVWIIVVWGVYRLIFTFPEVFEELILKPVVWFLPVVFFLAKDKLELSSIGITVKNIFPSIYFALSLGAVFALEGLMINYFKYGQINFSANLGTNPFLYSLGISFATAVSEEIVFRGFIFSRVFFALKNEWIANFLTSFGWSLVNLPIALFVWKMDIISLGVYGLLTFLFGIGAAFVFVRSKNILSPILLHIFWSWPIILFR